MAAERSNNRTAGPYNPDECGPVSGDVVVRKGTMVFIGTRSVPAQRDIYLRPPLDKGEVGTAFNDYTYND